MKRFTIIVAIDEHFGIGKNGSIPWRCPEDINHFNKTTVSSEPNKKNAVIMGRYTWLSLPDRYRPLPNRINIVITSQTQLDCPMTSSNLSTALLYCQQSNIDKIFICGGRRLYEEALYHPLCQEVIITKIKKCYNCDIFFSDLITLDIINSDFQLKYIENIKECDIYYSITNNKNE